MELERRRRRAAVAHAAELEREAAALAAAAAEVVQAKADAEQLTEEGARQVALRAAEAHATELQAALDGATRREAAAAAREVAAVARHMAATQAARDEANEMRQEAERAYEAELSRLELQVERAYAAEAEVNQRPPSHHLHAAHSRLTLLPRIPSPFLPKRSPQPHPPPPTPEQAAEIERLQARHEADKAELVAMRRKLWTAQEAERSNSRSNSSTGERPPAASQLAE